MPERKDQGKPCLLPLGLCLVGAPKALGGGEAGGRAGVVTRSAGGSEKDQKPERDAGPQGTAPGRWG